MGLKKSLAITFSVQVYSIIVTLALTPILISMVGAEGFGLIGFFLILQTLIQILDAGISGTLSRQIAISKFCLNAYRKFLSDFYKIYFGFFIIGICFFLFSVLFSVETSKNWFDTTLESELLTYCLIAMAASVAIKYFSGPLKSGLIGLESHKVIGAINFIAATLRYPGGILILFSFDNSLKHYFTYQVLVAFFEWFLLQIFFYKDSNKILLVARVNSDVEPQSLRTLLSLSLQLSVLSILWVIVSQLDKLLLSGVMTLERFGYYSLAVSVTGVILTLNIPLSQVLMPHLSSLAGVSSKQEYIKVFISALVGATVFFIPLSLVLFIYGEELVWAWTGDKKVASEAYQYIKWLALGNLIAVFMNFSFLLQFTLKKLKKHVLAYAVYCALLIPCMIFVVNQYEGEGAALFWFVHNAVFFIVWGGYSFSVYLKRVATIFFIPLIFVAISLTYMILVTSSSFMGYFSSNRLQVFLFLGGVGALCILTMGLLIMLNWKYIAPLRSKLILVVE